MSTSIGGYFYYSASKQHAIKEAHEDVERMITNVSDHISLFISENQKSIKALSGMNELQQPIKSNNEYSIAKVNYVLDHYKDAIEASVVYLMDHNGKTIASSNRNEPDSFVGKSYGFRPYFKRAVKGEPAVYMALGVTSKKRGIYFSHPVYADNQKKPSGVVVNKLSTEEIERHMKSDNKGIMVLTDPHGVIFMSSQNDWLFHVLWKVSDDVISDIAKSKQFGIGPWKWVGLKKRDDMFAVDKSGIEYKIHSIELTNYPGWEMIFLHNLRVVHESVTAPLFKSAGSIILALCILISLFVAVLYKMASYDIIQRKKAEVALKKALDTAKEFNKDLEPLVAERTMNLIALTVADKVRNPATVIGLICKRLLKKPDDIDILKAGISDIVSETHKLNETVSNYKILLESKKSMFVYDDINKVVREAITLIESEAEHKGVDLVIKLSNFPLKINLQRNLVRMAIFHLLTNAIEETPKGGTITVLTSSNDDKVFIVISDTGRGFKKEHLAKVFDPFFSTKKYSYGMGLPLVRQIVLEHFGEIEVESEEGQGTSFKMLFPVRWI